MYNLPESSSQFFSSYLSNERSYIVFLHSYSQDNIFKSDRNLYCSVCKFLCPTLQTGFRFVRRWRSFCHSSVSHLMTGHLAIADSSTKLIPAIALGTCYQRSDTIRQAAVSPATPLEQFSPFPTVFPAHVMLCCPRSVFAIPRQPARLFWRSRKQQTGFYVVCLANLVHFPVFFLLGKLNLKK